MRIIDADKLINETIFNPLHVPYVTKRDVENAPTVDAEPVKRGRWTEDDYCSECGQYVYHGDMRNFCPQCGADMREEV